MRDWHRELTDWLIENGGIGFSAGWQRLAAEHFKVHPSWISMMTNTDAFQDYYHRRTKLSKPRRRPPGGM
jgi:hypothetical protein